MVCIKFYLVVEVEWFEDCLLGEVEDVEVLVVEVEIYMKDVICFFN